MLEVQQLGGQQLGEWLHAHGGGIFVALFAVCAVLELAFARDRAAGPGRAHAMATNLTLMLAQTLFARVLPLSLVAIASFADEREWGLFQAWPAPGWLALGVTILARSLVDYGLHRASHAIALLWRLHRVHHTDRHVDLTTGLRHHPLELMPVLAVNGAAVLLLGPPLWAFMIAELLMLANQLWQHTELRMSEKWARRLGSIFVIPENHLIHHSALRCQTDSNFGTLLIVWDRLFGTFTAPGSTGPIRIGLGPQDDAAADSLWRQLALQFRPTP